MEGKSAFCAEGSFNPLFIGARLLIAETFFYEGELVPGFNPLFIGARLLMYICKTCVSSPLRFNPLFIGARLLIWRLNQVNAWVAS